jgi:hypothetical protein
MMKRRGEYRFSGESGRPPLFCFPEDKILEQNNLARQQRF